MTQAFNLSLFANKLNTSGQTDNTGLQNSSVTVTAGTGMSGGGAVALGSSVTLTNAGVTSFNGATGAVTATIGTGSVTSVATGNGLSGGTITTTGTLVVACPTYNSVGSYVCSSVTNEFGDAFTAGSNYAAGTGRLQTAPAFYSSDAAQTVRGSGLSGTWKWMAASSGGGYSNSLGVSCRVS
jgi:hypothetical protein